MTQQVLVRHDKGAQVLTLDRPEKKNAITPEMYAVLADALCSADAERHAASRRRDLGLSIGRRRTVRLSGTARL